MYEAQVASWGELPKYIANAPSAPAPTDEELQIKPIAVGIHRVVRSRAAGKHTSSGTPPHVPGVDGVGRVVGTDELVFFVNFGRGVMSEFINLPKSSIWPIPAGADPIQLAASINPAMSSWMALRARTNDLPSDPTVLILGATSASGRLAISLARSVRAKRIIGASRSESALRQLDLDDLVVVREDPAQTDFSRLGDVDIVIDYIYGDLVTHLFNALESSRPVQYVHIGALSGQTEMKLSAPLLRSKDITIRGSGAGAWTMDAVAKTMPELLQAAAKLPKQPVKVAKFEDVEKEWKYDGPERLVFVPFDVYLTR